MFKRIGNLLRGLAAFFVSGVERRNPEALLELEKEHLRAQIARYNQGIASHAGLCENLMAQVKTSPLARVEEPFRLGDPSQDLFKLPKSLPRRQNFS